MSRKIKKEYIDYGLGFPVHLLDVPMIKIRGEWAPDINFLQLDLVVLEALVHKPVRLTGNEIRFIRQYFELTLDKFGQRFNVSHVAVLKWEAKANQPTDMLWATEKDMRLFILVNLSKSSSKILESYKELEAEAPRHSFPLKVDASKLSA
jgi:transcriptional regulator with XRE-family HTH domain